MIGRGSRAERVTASHDIAWAAIRLALGAAAAAVAWAAVAVVADGSWWGPLHMLLAGTTLLAISGATQLFTTTWSAAVPPARRLAAAQRRAAFLGAAAAVGGVTLVSPLLVVVGGVLVLASLGLLSFSLVSTVRRSLLRRFDLSARFYLLAIGCALVGVTLGTVMGAVPTTRVALRLVHLHLNLVGFVGLTIFGTIPTFLPTLAHHRAVSGREALVAWRLAVGAAVSFVIGLAGGPKVVGVGSGLAAVAGALLLGGILVGLRWAGIRRGGVRFVLVAAGVGWLLVWMIADAVLLVGGGVRGAAGWWLTAAVIGGVVQVLAGSLGYLLPVVTRSHRRPGR